MLQLKVWSTSMQANEVEIPLRFLLNIDMEHSLILRQIQWTDEFQFDKDGITKYHTVQFWAPKNYINPHKKRSKGSQPRFNQQPSVKCL